MCVSLNNCQRIVYSYCPFSMNLEFDHKFAPKLMDIVSI